MDITYFYRNPKAGFSIYKVFNTLTKVIGKTITINEEIVPEHRAGLSSVLKNMIYIFRHRNKKGINHITGEIHYGILALIGCKTVLTIHDLSAMDCAHNPLKKFIMKWLWFKLPLMFATKVVCISAHTKSELLKITSRTDIEMIHNAVDPMFTAIEKAFNPHRPVILQIGTAWNKNLKNIIESIVNIPCVLVVIGNVSQELMITMKRRGISFEIKVGLSDADLFQEYVRADIISFCSIFEGFGMPIIEGNAIGRSVLTSSLAPMTEVAGNAASFVDPNDISSITAGLNRIITDIAYRTQIIRNGFENVGRFRAEYLAQEYITIYNTLT